MKTIKQSDVLEINIDDVTFELELGWSLLMILGAIVRSPLLRMEMIQYVVLSNLLEAFYPLFIEYTMSSGCLWMERPCSWIQFSFCGGDMDLVCIFAYFCLVWILTSERCFGDVERRGTEGSVFVSSVAWSPRWWSTMRRTGGSCFHHPHSQLSVILGRRRFRSIRKQPPWNSRSFLFLGPVQRTWRTHSLAGTFHLCIQLFPPFGYFE